VLFNSLAFLVFIAAFFPLYVVLKGRARLWLVLAASYLFYGWWDWRFLSLIAISTGVDYLVGRKLDTVEDAVARKRLLVLSVTVNLGLLGVFKYLGFFTASLLAALHAAGWNGRAEPLEIVLPVGISFYTFQTMSYAIDVYRRRIPVERDLLRFACFVGFFPQLVAGPIVRASRLLPQFREDQPIRWANVVHGVQLMLWGYFLKVGMADSLAAFVDQNFAHVDTMPSSSLFLGVLFYAFQIYGDFCGYSLIAIGLGRVLGFDLGVNFDRPYFSRSFSEFWKRWHISLSTWLRDYLYVSLGGNRRGVRKTYRNLMLTMLLGGLWHGAAWTFVVWGALHGCFLVVQRLVGPHWSRLVAALRVPEWLDTVTLQLTVFAFTCLAWVFFRARDFDTAFTLLHRLLTVDGWSLSAVPAKFQVIKGLALIAAVVTLEALSFRVKVSDLVVRRPAVAVATATAVIWAIALFGTFRGDAFIYFQF